MFIIDRIGFLIEKWEKFVQKRAFLDIGDFFTDYVGGEKRAGKLSVVARISGNIAVVAQRNESVFTDGDVNFVLQHIVVTVCNGKFLKISLLLSVMKPFI